MQVDKLQVSYEINLEKINSRKSRNIAETENLFTIKLLTKH